MPLPPLTSYKQIIFPDPDTAQLLDDIVTNTIPFPANDKRGIILYGPPGTGKTSLMKLLPDPIELARSGSKANRPTYITIVKSTNNTATIKQITSLAQNLPNGANYEYILLDEADCLGANGLNTLRGVMDSDTAIFIFATNNINEFPKPIVSRCHAIDMSPPPPAAVLGLVRSMLTSAGITTPISDPYLTDIIDKCGGDMRSLGAAIDGIIARPQKHAQPMLVLNP